jgi:hypothetical protein
MHACCTAAAAASYASGPRSATCRRPGQFSCRTSLRSDPEPHLPLATMVHLPRRQCSLPVDAVHRPGAAPGFLLDCLHPGPLVQLLVAFPQFLISQFSILGRAAAVIYSAAG